MAAWLLRTVLAVAAAAGMGSLVVYHLRASRDAVHVHAARAEHVPQTDSRPCRAAHGAGHPVGRPKGRYAGFQKVVILPSVAVALNNLEMTIIHDHYPLQPVKEMAEAET